MNPDIDNVLVRCEKEKFRACELNLKEINETIRQLSSSSIFNKF